MEWLPIVAGLEAAATPTQRLATTRRGSPVADTAWEAGEAISAAIEAAAGIDPTLLVTSDPETRLGRLVVAAQLLMLAGTDEGGQSDELELAATVLKLAAEA